MYFIAADNPTACRCCRAAPTNRQRQHERSDATQASTVISTSGLDCHYTKSRGRQAVNRAAPHTAGSAFRLYRVSISEPTKDKSRSGQLRSVTPLKAK
jgi:hypothetical protein